MTLVQRCKWSGTPLKAGLSPAAAHLRASPPAAGPPTAKSKQLEADTRLANCQLQTGGLEVTGNEWTAEMGYFFHLTRLFWEP